MTTGAPGTERHPGAQRGRRIDAHGARDRRGRRLRERGVGERRAFADAGEDRAPIRGGTELPLELLGERLELGDDVVTAVVARAQTLLVARGIDGDHRRARVAQRVRSGVGVAARRREQEHERGGRIIRAQQRDAAEPSRVERLRRRRGGFGVAARERERREQRPALHCTSSTGTGMRFHVKADPAGFRVWMTSFSKRSPRAT